MVDDAIVVVENVDRHIKAGEDPFRAAIIGTREIALPVISMTITLAAVYAPIALMGGITGSLFKEFALTLAGSVFVSGVIALTLSPMMCSKMLKPHSNPNAFERGVENTFSEKGHQCLFTGTGCCHGTQAGRDRFCSHRLCFLAYLIQIYSGRTGTG